MPITLFLAKLAIWLFVLLLVTQDKLFANTLAWLLFGGFFVMVAEAIGLVSWAANGLFGRYPGSKDRTD